MFTDALANIDDPTASVGVVWPNAQHPAQFFAYADEEWDCDSDLCRVESLLEPLALQMRLEGWLLRRYGRGAYGTQEYGAERVGGQTRIKATTLIELVQAIFDDCANRAPRKAPVCQGCRRRHINSTYGY